MLALLAVLHLAASALYAAPQSPSGDAAGRSSPAVRSAGGRQSVPDGVRRRAEAGAQRAGRRSVTAPGPRLEPRVYSGRDNQVRVATPRVDADVDVDGVLDEAAWGEAAVLTGFSQYQPVDGVPAEDSTEVLVWYSPSALHVGIRAFEPHAAVNATLADRDRISGDDHVRLYLDTFNDRRRAYVFGVNPLGVQEDGTVTEEQRPERAAYSAEVLEGGRVDISPDYLFESRGRVTEWGYEVEVRIPFKSIRYAEGEEQTWGFHVLRSVQHSGQVQSWAPVRKGTTSLLAQGGSLEGLDGLRRGLVLDLNPVVTQQVPGAPGAGGAWRYDGERPEPGLNVRWGITPDLSLNATLNPDFSQVEADVAQVQFDPRQALSFPEKRPFFLEGSEQFAVPNGLVYTRRIADPIAAAKVSGRVGRLDVGFLSAVDDEALSATGTDHPVYSILRVRRMLGERSSVAFTYTDRVEGGDFNRVASVDARLVPGGPYVFSLQAAGSATREGGRTRLAPFWDVGVERTGREAGWTFRATGIHPDFHAGSGFIARPAIAKLNFTPRLTRFGSPGSVLESWTGAASFDHTWKYSRFAALEPRPEEARLHLNNAFVLRGGWRLGASVLLESFRYPEELYADYAIDTGADTVPFAGRPHIENLDLVLTFATPRFPTFAADGLLLVGRDENFPEWAPGYIVASILTGLWRPTERVRLEGRYNEVRVLRTTDRSQVTLTQIPRLKLEYQVARPLFVRFVGQYVAFRQDALRDDGRTNAPILIRDPETGVYERSAPLRSNGLRMDWLVSYQPNPGTVLFAGYGSSLAEERAFRFDDLARTQDGFFLKVSYLFRL